MKDAFSEVPPPVPALIFHDQFAIGSSAIAEALITTLPSAAGAPGVAEVIVTVGACGGGGGGGGAVTVTESLAGLLCWPLPVPIAVTV